MGSPARMLAEVNCTSPNRLTWSVKSRATFLSIALPPGDLHATPATLLTLLSRPQQAAEHDRQTCHQQTGTHDNSRGLRQPPAGHSPIALRCRHRGRPTHPRGAGSTLPTALAGAAPSCQLGNLALDLCQALQQEPAHRPGGPGLPRVQPVHGSRGPAHCEGQVCALGCHILVQEPG